MEIRKEVCTCDKCGNEAEMTITCSIVTLDEDAKKQVKKESRKCSVCGNEADMILED